MPKFSQNLPIFTWSEDNLLNINTLRLDIAVGNMLNINVEEIQAVWLLTGCSTNDWSESRRIEVVNMLNINTLILDIAVGNMLNISTLMQLGFN